MEKFVSKEHKHNYPLSKRIAAFIFPYILRFFVTLIFFTCKKKYNFPKNKIPSPSVWVTWHGQIIMIPFLYKKTGIEKAVNIIVSEHLHGDFAVRIFKHFSLLRYIRGSSRKGAIKALKSAIEKLEAGENVGITPDGPKGPLHSISDGVITLALKCKVPVIAIGWRATRFWQLRSWDEARIPKPFSTITYTINESIYIDENIDKDVTKALIKDAIMRCMN